MADMEIGSFTPEQARLLWQFYQQSIQLKPALQNNTPERRNIDEPSPHRIFVKNESGEEIPAYGCMEVTGVVTEVGRVFLKVTKPTTICGEYIFNSQFKIAAGAYGWGYAFGIVRMLGGTGTYEPCKRYGATVDSWAISQNHGGFLVYGDDGENAGVVIGRIIGDHCKARFITFQYELGGDNSTATPEDYYDGQDPSPCGTPEIEYPLGEPCTDGSLVVAFFDPNTGKYQAIATKNAIMGDPVTKDIMLGSGFGHDGCALNYTKQSMKVITCDSDPEPLSTSPQTITFPVVTNVYKTTAGIYANYGTVEVCSGYFGGSALLLPFYVCPPDPEPDCSGTATWQWSHDDQRWYETTPCPNGCTSSPPADPSDVNKADPAFDGAPTANTQPCAEITGP